MENLQNDFKNRNITVYKYRDWNNNYHKSILVDNEIYLPSPDELNDPFDFQLKLDFTQLNSEYKQDKFIGYFLKDFLQINPNAWKQRNIVNTARNNLTKLLKDNPFEFSKQFHTIIAAAFSKHYGILCLSHSWDSITMWTHYAINHTGFCIGLDNEKVKNLLQGSGGQISYHPTTAYPSIDPLDWFEKHPMETILKLTLTKSIDWKYENEFRHLLLWDVEPSKKQRTITFDDSFINEIILGVKIPNDNEKEIRRICEQKNIPVYKIKKSDNQFGLEKERL